MSARLLSSWMRSLHMTSAGSLFRRGLSTSEANGVILPKPAKSRFGLMKVTLFVIPFLSVGAMISREGAAWLEEHDIFSPEDDD